MPRPGYRWRFVTIGTLNSWLPGDERGWRSRKHRRHSSGDYRHPPPPGEHRGLLEYCRQRSGAPLFIPEPLRERLGVPFLKTLLEQRIRVLGIAVAAYHAHILAELPDLKRLAQDVIGNAKRDSSRAVRKEMPGRLWAGGGRFDPVDTREHLLNALLYILRHREEGAWVWWFREPVPQLASI